MGQLVGEDRCDPERNRRRCALSLEIVQALDERQVGGEGGLAEPVPSVRPASVVQHPGQVAVQGEHEVHGHGDVTRAATAR